MKNYKEFVNLNESSLSRLYSKMEKHDTGTITAFRDGYTKKENNQRNKSLLAKIQAAGYGATIVKGSYIENFGTPEAEEVSESVFFVEDMNDNGNLKKKLMSFGESFDQDSVLFIPKGGLNAILIGTNDAEFPGFHKSVPFSKRSFGSAGEFMTKVKNRPFMFESIERYIQNPSGYLGHMACHSIAETPWREIEE